MNKKIIRMNGCIENFEGITYDWVCGETEYSLAYGKDGYSSWKEIEKYLHTADDCEKVAKILKQDIDKKRKEGTL